MFLFLFLTLIWSSLNGQTGPVFQYNHPSKQTLQSLASEQTPKGISFRSYMIEVLNLNLKDTTLILNEASIPFIFNNLYFEEIYLQEGDYTNSGFSYYYKRMVPSLGHKWTGFAWVFRIGTFSIPLIKEDCGNILNCKASRIAIVQKKEVSKESETEPVIVSIEINNKINGDSTITERKDTIISAFPGKGSVVVVKINNEINFKNPFPNTVSNGKKPVRKSHFWNWAIPIIGVAILGTVYYFVNKGSIIDEGRPGGAPLTRDPYVPPTTEGPGGAPLTK